MQAAPPVPTLVIVMGVCGSGKSTVGAGLAAQLGAVFIEGDSLHPQGNVAKMAAGMPLNDEDRWPWLAAIGAALAAERQSGRPAVASCSALRRIYRDRLRQAVGGDLLFVYLNGTRDMLAGRMAGRSGHYMPATLLDSQLATLEKPGADEALVLDIACPSADLIAVAALSCRATGLSAARF